MRLTMVAFTLAVLVATTPVQAQEVDRDKNNALYSASLIR